MTEPPDFTAIIAAGQRAASEKAAAASLAAEEQSARRRRLLILAEEALRNVVDPVLDIAARDLQLAGVPAEIGNGRDRHGGLRLSLRIARASHALVFTACDGLAPFLGWSAEPIAMETDRAPIAIDHITPGTVTRIVGEFLVIHIQ